jgi:hypothetical protein
MEQTQRVAATALPGARLRRSYALVSGRLRIAKSGDLLAATVTGGVKIYPTRAPSGS